MRKQSANTYAHTFVIKLYITLFLYFSADEWSESHFDSNLNIDSEN
jgi:hypothetical protein